MLPRWLNDYIGMPFLDHGRDAQGCDCWGLVRLVLAEQFEIDVPSYGTAYSDCKSAEIGPHIDDVAKDWRQVEDEAAQPGDVVVLRIAGQPWHVGLVIEAGMMLHVERGLDACLERYDGPHWSKRLVGIYRHQ
ncbi:MAG: C40 family peptidase [Desulfuromonadales bacterium]|nr:C40 family peptidase [Desulfuromonadales bacterium]